MSGHVVTPPLFWALVDASFQKEDHQEKRGQKMIFACLGSVRQRRGDYHNFLVEHSINIPRSLKGLFVKLQQKRSHPHKKGGPRITMTSNSTGKLLNNTSFEGGGANLGWGEGGGREGGVSENGPGAMSPGAESDFSDDVSDSMSVLSYMSRETTYMSSTKVQS